MCKLKESIPAWVHSNLQKRCKEQWLAFPVVDESKCGILVMCSLSLCYKVVIHFINIQLPYRVIIYQPSSNWQKGKKIRVN